MSIVNPSFRADLTAETTLPNGFTFQQTFILHIIFGLTTESALYAVFAVFVKLFNQTLQKDRLFLAEAIISCCNISIICNTVANIVLLLPIGNSVTCLSVQLVSNLFSHMISFTFDTFILYRSWIISGRDKWCSVISTLLILNRLFWGIWDLCKSRGEWDEASQTCDFAQDSTSLIGYSWLDLLCDLFATVVAVVVIARHIGWDFADTNYMTVMSMFRSSLVASTNIAIMVTGALWPDSFWLNMAWAIQTYVLCRCLNAEIILPEMKKTVTQLATPSSRNKAVLANEVKKSSSTSSGLLPMDTGAVVHNHRSASAHNLGNSETALRMCPGIPVLVRNRSVLGKD